MVTEHGLCRRVKGLIRHTHQGGHRPVIQISATSSEGVFRHTLVVSRLMNT